MKMKEKKFFVYMLRCSDNSLYTGYTVDSVKKRVQVHNDSAGAKYTRSRLPVKLVYYEEAESRSHALKRELQIKKLTKKEKEELISSFV